LTLAAAAELQLLENAARAAGDRAMDWFREGGQTAARVTAKEGGSPVSEADLAANAAARTILMDARPDYAWLSEETADDGSRLSGRPYFIVDPIDGTRAFIAGQTDWCVSLALVIGSRPLAGVLYQPTRRRLFAAALAHGAFLDGARLSIPATGPATIMAGGPKPLIDALEREKPARIERHPRIASLALRMAAVATGQLSIAFAHDGAHDWDVAAVDIIVSEANGLICEADGAPLAYGRAGLRRGAMVAAGPALVPLAARLLG
jgi:myo-inositol-1(or 4)-monophosphatase